MKTAVREPEEGDPTVLICVDEFGPLNLQPHPGRQWALAGGRTRRPATVHQVEGTLRKFALFLSREASEVSSVATIRRRHVEAYRLWLAKRPAHGHSRPLTRKTQAKRLACLRQFFDRLTRGDPGRPRLSSRSQRHHPPVWPLPLPALVAAVYAAEIGGAPAAARRAGRA